MSRRSDDRLVAYLDGELEASERRDIEAWLDSDPAARDKLAALAQSAELLREPSTRCCANRYPIG